MAKSKQRDLSERQFLKAVESVGMNIHVGVVGHFSLGIPGRNIWGELPDPKLKLNRRAKLDYMLGLREAAKAKVEAERAAYTEIDPELIFRSLPRGEDR